MCGGGINRIIRGRETHPAMSERNLVKAIITSALSTGQDNYSLDLANRHLSVHQEGYPHFHYYLSYIDMATGHTICKRRIIP